MTQSEFEQVLDSVKGPSHSPTEGELYRRAALGASGQCCCDGRFSFIPWLLGGSWGMGCRRGVCLRLVYVL